MLRDLKSVGSEVAANDALHVAYHGEDLLARSQVPRVGDACEVARRNQSAVAL